MRQLIIYAMILSPEVMVGGDIITQNCYENTFRKCISHILNDILGELYLDASQNNFLSYSELAQAPRMVLAPLTF